MTVTVRCCGAKVGEPHKGGPFCPGTTLRRKPSNDVPVVSPHEETWEADRLWVRRTRSDQKIALVAGHVDREGGARSRLIACAPEMARMLLANEWRFTYDRFERDDGSYTHYECMTCAAAKDAGHSDDCAWLALMRKAGLR